MDKTARTRSGARPVSVVPALAAAVLVAVGFPAPASGKVVVDTRAIVDTLLGGVQDLIHTVNLESNEVAEDFTAVSTPWGGRVSITGIRLWGFSYTHPFEQGCGVSGRLRVAFYEADQEVQGGPEDFPGELIAEAYVEPQVHWVQDNDMVGPWVQIEATFPSVRLDHGLRYWVSVTSAEYPYLQLVLVAPYYQVGHLAAARNRAYDPVGGSGGWSIGGVYGELGPQPFMMPMHLLSTKPGSQLDEISEAIGGLETPDLDGLATAEDVEALRIALLSSMDDHADALDEGLLEVWSDLLAVDAAVDGLPSLEDISGSTRHELLPIATALGALSDQVDTRASALTLENVAFVLNGVRGTTDIVHRMVGTLQTSVDGVDGAVATLRGAVDGLQADVDGLGVSAGALQAAVDTVQTTKASQASVDALRDRVDLLSQLLGEWDQEARDRELHGRMADSAPPRAADLLAPGLLRARAAAEEALMFYEAWGGNPARGLDFLARGDAALGNQQRRTAYDMYAMGYRLAIR